MSFPWCHFPFIMHANTTQCPTDHTTWLSNDDVIKDLIGHSGAGKGTAILWASPIHTWTHTQPTTTKTPPTLLLAKFNYGFCDPLSCTILCASFFEDICWTFNQTQLVSAVWSGVTWYITLQHSIGVTWIRLYAHGFVILAVASPDVMPTSMVSEGAKKYQNYRRNDEHCLYRWTVWQWLHSVMKSTPKRNMKILVLLSVQCKV